MFIQLNDQNNTIINSEQICYVRKVPNNEIRIYTLNGKELYINYEINDILIDDYNRIKNFLRVAL